MMRGYYYGNGPEVGAFPWNIGGAILMVLFWVLVAIVFVAILRHFMHSDHHGEHQAAIAEAHHCHCHDDQCSCETDTPQRLSPLDIVRERYARGEIDKAEFDQMKRDLTDPMEPKAKPAPRNNPSAPTLQPK